MSTYLWINLGAVAIPFILSFDKKVAFYRKWKYHFPSLAIVAFIFIFWDIQFTRMEVWGFNPLHLSGLYIFNLPLEEVLFFFSIPYASVFTYEVLNTYIKKDLTGKAPVYISGSLAIILIVSGIYNIDRWYTSVTFLSTGTIIILLQYVMRFPKMGRFYIAYAVVIMPFLIVNGLLTGSWIHQEVVWYNNSENLGIRILTIPIEDFIYGMELILLNVVFFEYLQNYRIRWSK